MGKKRGKKRKHLLLYCACLLTFLSLLSTGCVPTQTVQKHWQGYKHLDLAESLKYEEDYEAALKEYDRVVELFPENRPGDKALFHKGLTLAHPDNPQMDYEKALECFLRLERKFPQNPYQEEARVLSRVISELIRSENELERTENELDRSRKEFVSSERRIKDLEATVSDLKKRLEVFKEIDIEIEEKKRGNLLQK